MTALKAYQVDQFLKNSIVKSGAYLVYGSDFGLVHERSKKLCMPVNPNGQHVNTNSSEITILEMDEIQANPEKLAIEVLTPSLFGDAAIIRIRNGNKYLAPILGELLQSRLDVRIIIEAANLTKRDKLRVLIEESKQGWTLPSFADDTKSLNTLVAQFFQEQSVSISAEARTYLGSILGNDREITRRELEKLANFASEHKTLNLNDIESLCGDNSMIALDRLLDAIGLGNAMELEISLDRAYNSGLDSQVILLMTARHFNMLRTLRAKMNEGSSANAALASYYPKPHFTRLKLVERQISQWKEKSIANAAKRLFEATLLTRQQASLSQTITRRTLLGICLAASKY